MSKTQEIFSEKLNDKSAIKKTTKFIINFFLKIIPDSNLIKANLRFVRLETLILKLYNDLVALK